jgi:hypothetical protein
MQVAVSTSEVHHVTMETRPSVSYSQEEKQRKAETLQGTVISSVWNRYALLFVLRVHEMKKDKRLQITKGNTWNHIWIDTLTS